jgi:hypothetical protein
MKAGCAVRTLLAAVSLLLLAEPSWAVLGERVDSLAADRQRLHGEMRSSAGEGFSVYEITAADGTVVRQYASTSGRVFAVSWRGPFVPDLAQLLGSYFPDFQQAAHSAVRRRGPLVARTSRLVVATGGHMRAFHGLAYIAGELPPAVPEGVVR